MVHLPKIPNALAVEQLRPILAADGIEVEVFDLPHDQGPDYCLHLLSLISPVRADLAMVYERLAPVALIQALQRRGIEILSLPEEDYLSLGCNLLAVAPGVVVMATGNDATAALLRQHGVEVHLYEASSGGSPARTSLAPRSSMTPEGITKAGS